MTKLYHYVTSARRVLQGIQTPLGRRALRYRTAATLMPTGLLREIQPNLVVDVGANRGQFLLDVRKWAPNARVVAFEPLESEFNTLARIHGRDATNDLRMLALGEVPGSAVMHVSAAADSSSLLPISDEQERVFPGTREIGEVSVPLSTLDAELESTPIPSRSLLKLDVQGGEIRVLAGATTVLPKFEFVLVEVSFVELYSEQPLAGEVCEFLSQHGFRLDRVLSLSLVGDRPIQADLVFRRRVTTND